jgi:hypothetical protein
MSEFLDLVGMHVEGLRKQQKFTVLRKTNCPAWVPAASGQLATGLMTDVYSSPKHLDTLMLFGEFSKEQIERVLGYSTFSVEVIQGTDNPKLPFRPPLD